MTFVYCNAACLLYTRGRSRGALRKQSVQPGDIPRMRERTDVAGIQIGIGIQRIRARGPNGLRALCARSPVLYTMYGFALSCTYDSSSGAVCVAHVGDARIPARISHLANRRERQKRDLRPAVIPIVAYPRIRYIASDTSKWSATRSSNCEVSGDSDTIYRCGTLAAKRA